MLKALVVFLLAGIILSLFSGLFFLNRDQGGSRRMVRALTVRITLSVILFLVLLYAWFSGLIQPHGVGPG
ncbi:MAG: twin transmembrane helix small protein [Gammaproteobacteria bacterium]|nr:twin transmembrane helix small protein [Gammaproteobacteria bacterium]